MRRFLFSLVLVASISTASAAFSWDSYALDLKVGAAESIWRDALAAKLGGQSEVAIEGGRVDVLTDQWAIEIDKPGKWHEGLGQALHYGDVTERQPVLALMSHSINVDNIQERVRRRYDLVEEQCVKNGVQLVILYARQSQVTSTPDEATSSHWLNTLSGTRHNLGCHFFHNTDQGRSCGPSEGRACTKCGG